MEQNKRMLEDRDTNFVYLSEWLEKEHPEFFSELTTLFNSSLGWISMFFKQQLDISLFFILRVRIINAVSN